MEENEIREQPQEVETIENDSAEFQLDDFDGSLSGQLQEELSEDRSEAERGVPVGKFKSVDDLLDAYNNLQAEFTRKCQRLSALEKNEKMAKMAGKNQNNNNILETGEVSDKAVADNLQAEKNISAFLEKNPDAFAYVDEIKSMAENDESLKGQDGAFEKAWEKILWKKLSSPSRAKEPLVQNLILKDTELKNLILENYVKQLQEQKLPVIMSNSGERVTKVVTPKPDSFEQAKKVVIDLLS